MTDSVLVVDDDPVQRRLLEAAVTRYGYTPVLADGGQAALDRIEGEQSFGAIVLDLVMPGVDGLAVLERIRERGLRVPVIVQTAKGGIETVVAAMRAGAFDFVVKPVSPERLRTAVANAIKLERVVATPAHEAARRGGGAEASQRLVSQSAAMQRVLRLVDKASSSDIPILVDGESGVGKELVARAIRHGGSRRSKPFVTVNCGAIPANLVESLLFGHEKGAFTGATERHAGKFVEANGGTLFLDEVSELPLDIQVKLLRALQEGEVDPVGGRGPVKVDFRLISATNRDLLEDVRKGRFREDLFYRLNVFPLTVPPLRERKQDIPALVERFIALHAEQGRRARGISARALEILCAHDWPGNIRQLENAIFRAVVLCEGDVLTADEFPQIRAQVEEIDLETHAGNDAVPADSRGAASENPAGVVRGVEPLPSTTEGAQAPEGLLEALDAGGEVRPLADLESDMIRLAIRHYDGQMSEVARRLGIGRSTLYRKLKDMGLDTDDGRALARRIAGEPDRTGLSPRADIG